MGRLDNETGLLDVVDSAGLDFGDALLAISLIRLTH